MTRKSPWLLPALTVAALSMSPGTLSRAEAQSARPQIDHNASAEWARARLQTGTLSDLSSRFRLFNNCAALKMSAGSTPHTRDCELPEGRVASSEWDPLLCPCVERLG